jgi:hypothetical protein
MNIMDKMNKLIFIFVLMVLAIMGSAASETCWEVRGYEDFQDDNVTNIMNFKLYENNGGAIDEVLFGSIDGNWLWKGWQLGPNHGDAYSIFEIGSGFDVSTAIVSFEIIESISDRVYLLDNSMNVIAIKLVPGGWQYPPLLFNISLNESSTPIRYVKFYHYNPYLTRLRIDNVTVFTTNCIPGHWLEDEHCNGDDIWDTYRNFSCTTSEYSPGSELSCCTYENNDELKQECPETCDKEECVDFPCHSDSECGSDGLAGNEYCIGNEIWDSLRTWDCVDANTRDARCEYNDAPQKQQTCAGSCRNGACFNDPKRVCVRGSCYEYYS